MSQTHAKLVVCGAGIAGVAAAYHLAVVHGARDVVLVEAENPLSMTSDKSTEAYRNWWPGPDPAMTAFMNRSIDLLEELAHATGNRFNMNRRGYLFATADADKVGWLGDVARQAQAHGAGPVRMHSAGSDSYVPAAETGFDSPLTGADVITDASLIRRHFPFLAPSTIAVAHARRAGWLSAQQLGMTFLEAARDAGVRLLRGRLSGVDAPGGRLARVHVAAADGTQALEATHLVLSPGPMLAPVAALLGLELPIFAERHRKISFPETLGILPAAAPMVIWLDAQRLPWSPEERAVLAESEATAWLLDPFPPGVHARLDGRGGGRSLLVLFNHHNDPQEVVFPLPEDPHYAEIALRAMTTPAPALAAYVDKGVRPYVDGGYYVKTAENRPLIGPLPVEGVYISAAYSGFGIMASCAGGDLLARHVLGKPLPAYAPAFLLSRYEDPDYRRMLDAWGDGGQL